MAGSYSSRRSCSTPATATSTTGSGSRPAGRPRGVVGGILERGSAETASRPSRLGPILDHLETALVEVHDGELSPARASAKASLGRAMVSVLEAGELEERLAALEERLVHGRVAGERETGLHDHAPAVRRRLREIAEAVERVDEQADLEARFRYQVRNSQVLLIEETVSAAERFDLSREVHAGSPEAEARMLELVADAEARLKAGEGAGRGDQGLIEEERRLSRQRLNALR